MAETITKFGTTTTSLNFQPVKVPLPLNTDIFPIAQQLETYQSYEVKDDLVLPEGFTYDLIAAWGDRVGDSSFWLQQ